LHIIKLFYILIFLVQLYSINSYEVNCDYMGDCSFIIDNKPFQLSQGNIPLYNQISNEKINYKLNNTFYPLKLEKQINGVSNYGLLKGTKNGYECSGGLLECKDSCCLDGFCVEILFFCDQENEYITFISILLTTVFLTLIILYWVTYCFLGFKFKDDLTKTMKEEKELYYNDYYRNNQINNNVKGNRESTISAYITDNGTSQVPIMNSVINSNNNVLKN